MSAVAPRILVSNDDGIDAPGLALLASVARGLSDDVWTVAPTRKWTAASHQITFDRDLTLAAQGPQRYACDGTPVDCVVAAMTLLFADAAHPDLVLAGINDKRNVGEDAAYSGTMAIAREATFWGIPAVAFSRSERWTDTPPEVASLRRLITAVWTTRGHWARDGHWLSVNLPPRLPAPLRAARLAHDKLGTAVDVLARQADRWVYRLRRGRPGTASHGDENDVLRVGDIAVVRHRWRDAGLLDDEWIGRMSAAVADDEPAA